MAGPKGHGSSTIRLNVDVTAEAGGHSKRHLPDGTVVDGPSRQEFVEIDKDRIASGDWVLNPLTGETHKVLGNDGDSITLSTTDGSITVPWSDLPDALLLVVDV